MKYSPIVCGEIDTHVVAFGVIGVWRMIQLDYFSSDVAVVEEMENEEYQFQPELQNFCVTDIFCGDYPKSS